MCSTTALLCARPEQLVNQQTRPVLTTQLDLVLLFLSACFAPNLLLDEALNFSDGDLNCLDGVDGSLNLSDGELTLSDGGLTLSDGALNLSEEIRMLEL